MVACSSREEGNIVRSRVLGVDGVDDHFVIVQNLHHHAQMAYIFAIGHNVGHCNQLGETLCVILSQGGVVVRQ